jgi:hypothetical protein
MNDWSTSERFGRTAAYWIAAPMIVIAMRLGA